jgi:3'(2'), 5'-bisphosphate nucleotidase
MPRSEQSKPLPAGALKRALGRAAGAALEAGAAILEVYNRPFDVTLKQDDTPVTEADLCSHRIIKQALSGGPGDFPLLSEEGAAVPWTARRHWPAYWLVDPLDGTREFVNRSDEFTVNIALVEAGRPVLGLIYAPVFRVLYAGARGLGACKIEDLQPLAEVKEPLCWETLAARGRRLHPVLEPRDGPPRVVGSRSHQNDAFRDFLAGLEADCPGTRLFVSGSALKFCYLAEGRATIYPCFGRTMEWDTAAGQAIVNQVGKKVRALVDMQPGEELVYNKKDLRTGPFIAR